MSKSSLFGLILGWGIVFISIRLATPDMLMFWDLNSFLLVIIGPYFSMLMAYSGSDVHAANKNWLGIFKNRKIDAISYKDEVGRFVRWAYITQKNGLQGLENDAMSSVGDDDPFLMLGNMGADPASIGTGMAVALITTFYGVMSARLIYLPAGIKLSARNDEELFRNLLITESLVLLAERKSPRYIQDKLNAFIDPSQHFLIDRDMQR